MYHVKTTEKFDPKMVLRVPRAEDVFSIQPHPNNASNQTVTDYERQNRSVVSPDRWRGFDKGYAGGTKTAVDSVKFELANGWPDGCKLINAAREKVLNATLAAPASRRLRMEHGHVTGFNPHVPTLMQGQPTAYSQWGRKSKIAAVRLLCELTASANLAADQLVWRGAATLVIADLLQEAGYAVEVWAMNTCASGEDLHTPTCTAALVKSADNAPIPDVLASVLVSPRYYRVGMLDSLKAFSPHVPWGHGQTRELDPAHLEGTDLEDLKDGIYIGACFSLEAAVEKINAVTKQINGA